MQTLTSWRRLLLLAAATTAGVAAIKARKKIAAHAALASLWAAATDGVTGPSTRSAGAEAPLDTPFDDSTEVHTADPAVFPAS